LAKLLNEELKLPDLEPDTLPVGGKPAKVKPGISMVAKCFAVE
jgi:hypothetical protein